MTVNHLKKETILKLQKKTVRIITHSQRLEHSRPLFTKYNIFRLEKIMFIKLHLVFKHEEMMMYRIIKPGKQLNSVQLE